MAEIDPVILELRAELSRYRAELRATTSLVSGQLGSQERSVKRLEQQFRRSSAAIGSNLKALAGSFATYFSGRELVSLIDSFTRFQNQLKVAGLEGTRLAEVQERLRGIGSQYGVELEALASVFNRASLAQRELGASSEQIIQLNEVVAASLKVAGTSTQEASGALLQLSQALGSGVVRAEEFNSILEGALPLAQAAARGIDGMGGSVAKLRAEIVEGNITSRQFFEGILKGGTDTINQAENATLTLSGAFTALRNELVLYVGEASQSNGITAALADGLKRLADNLDTVFEALAVIVTFLGVRYVASAGAAIAANISLAASATGAAGSMGIMGAAAFSLQAYMAGAATATEALGFAMAGLARALPVVAMGALAVAIVYYATQTNRAVEASADYKRQLDYLKTAQEKAAGAADQLATATGRAREQALANARALREENVQLLANARAAAQAARVKLQTVIEENRERLRAASRSTRGAGGGIDPIITQQRINSRIEAQARADIMAAETAAAGFAKTIHELDEAIKAAPRVGEGGGSDARPSGSRRQSTGPAPGEIARRFEDELDNYRSQIAGAQANVARSLDERAELELRQVELARRATLRSIEADSDYSQAQKARLALAVENLANAEREAIEFRRRADAEREAEEIAEERFRADLDALELQYDLARTEADRRYIAQRILDAEDAYLKSKLEAVIASETATDAERERARIALAALRNTAAARRAASDRAHQGALGRYLDDTADIEARAEEAAVRELEAVRDGLADGLSEQLGVKNQFVKDMLSIFLDEVLFRPIAEALRGGGGAGSIFSSIFGAIFGRASGGYVSPGGVYRVNEHRPGVELLRLGPQGGKVIPLGEANQQIASPRAGSAGTLKVVIEEAPGFAARVRTEAAGVAVEVQRLSRPALIEEAVSETFSRAGRPRL